MVCAEVIDVDLFVVLEGLEEEEAKEEEGNIFASVTSTACACTPCTTSHLVVKRARRIASAGPGVTAPLPFSSDCREDTTEDEDPATTEGDIAIANKCSRCAVLSAGSVMLASGCSDGRAVDHW
jgi:hypothetical protein